VRPAQLLFPPFAARALQLAEDGFVDRARRPVGEEDLVGAGECALEPHRTGIILGSGPDTLCRAFRPRPTGAKSEREQRDGDTGRCAGTERGFQVVREAARRQDLLRRRPAPRNSSVPGRALRRWRKHLGRRARRGARSPWLLPRLEKTGDRDRRPLRGHHPLRAGREPGPNPRHSTLGSRLPQHLEETS
jgi:hypothetical protein